MKLFIQFISFVNLQVFTILPLHLKLFNWAGRYSFFSFVVNPLKTQMDFKTINEKPIACGNNFVLLTVLQIL